MGRSKPLEQCYWVESGRLLAGDYPGHYHQAEARAKLRKLLGAGVDLFLDLTERDERLHGRAVAAYDALLREEAASLGRAVEHRRMSIPDLGIPSVPRMRAILDAVDRALRAGGMVYLHCLGGTGRTGTVVGCHLVRRGLSGEEALSRVARLIGGTPKAGRPSPDTEQQREFVRRWAEQDRAKPAAGGEQETARLGREAPGAPSRAGRSRSGD